MLWLQLNGDANFMKVSLFTALSRPLRMPDVRANQTQLAHCVSHAIQLSCQLSSSPHGVYVYA